MTDGRWSVGIACSATGDEDVILYDGQEVSVWDAVEVLNRLEAINRDQHRTTVDPVMDIHIELSALINRYSLENGSDTPDFALSQYLMACLRAYEQAVKQRENWAGRGDPDEHLLHGDIP